ncbi:MAG: ACT domain-containing protein [Gemmatales bacterium]|nr:ACT domain-containing protein [Gemmatales bacterium]MDW8176610.1 ACT domain-containing protein [Gemmatales bacterium]
MALEVKKIDVYVAEIDDRPGALAEKLAPLAEAGVDLAFAFARRRPDVPGKGVVYLGPIATAKGKKAAQAAGIVLATDIAALRAEGPNRPGALYDVAKVLGEAGINLRGVSAGVIAKRWVCFLAFDNKEDAQKAARLLKKVK